MAASGVLACISERDRLDVPEIELLLDALEVAAGSEIRGRILASDASGLVRVRLIATSAYDTVRDSENLPDDRVLDVRFFLPLVDSIPPGAKVVIEATVFDNQDFVVSDTDTVRVVEP